MPNARLKTRDEIREDFRKNGVTIRQWSKDRDFNERTVYAVISGENKGNYGKAHEIAICLGLKEEPFESR